ncbi:MAG: hypothetical protein CMK09_12625 [Ponticaulis sp.]|nr:hypothetical protein [Ponticaulis sp.]|tara:strand:+ start:964 stop:1773 length:810 start_codon:yes stop_codon:yes gene_type:complete
MSEAYESDGAPKERSTYSAFGDEYRGFDARDEDGGSKGALVLALAAGVVLVFGTVVWNAYRQGTKASPEDAPVFAADDTPYKHRPQTAKASEPQSKERMFEEGKAPDEKLIPASASTPDGKPRDLRPEAVVRQDPPENTERRVAEARPTPPIVREEPKPTPTPTVSQPRELPPAAPQTVTGRFDQSGDYLVQVMALRDLNATQRAWLQLSEAYSDLFSGAEMDIQRADLGAKGIFFRLRASAFSTREDADDFCSKLKGRGQSCMVVARS